MADRFEYKNGIWREKTPVWMAGEVANSAGSSNRMYSPGPDDPCPDCVEEKRTALAAQYVGGAARQFEEEKARTTQRVQQTALKTGLRKVPFHQAAFDLVTETKKQAGEEEAASIYSGFSEGEKAGLGRVDSPLELDWPGCSGLYPETSFEAFNCACAVMAALRELSSQNAEYWNEAVQALDDELPWKACELSELLANQMSASSFASISAYVVSPPVPPPPTNNQLFTEYSLSMLIGGERDDGSVTWLPLSMTDAAGVGLSAAWWPQVPVATDGSYESQTLVTLLSWMLNRCCQLSLYEFYPTDDWAWWADLLGEEGARHFWYGLGLAGLPNAYFTTLVQAPANNPIRAAYVEHIADGGPLLEVIDTSPCEEEEIDEPTCTVDQALALSQTSQWEARAECGLTLLAYIIDNCETNFGDFLGDFQNIESNVLRFSISAMDESWAVGGSKWAGLMQVTDGYPVKVCYVKELPGNLGLSAQTGKLHYFAAQGGCSGAQGQLAEAYWKLMVGLRKGWGAANWENWAESNYLSFNLEEWL